MSRIKKSTITEAQAFGAVTVAVVGVWLWGRSGSRRVTVAPVNEAEVRPNFDARFWARKLHDALNGWAVSIGTYNEVMADLIRMSQGELASVYNEYAKLGKKSMRQALADEWLWWGTDGSRDRDIIVDRLQRLNLT